MAFLRLRGLIRRRILVNFRAAPDVIQKVLPQPFHPKLLGDWAMAGICLIRLERIRPAFVPIPIGLSSENAAHRIAVRWTDEEGRPREGVYIPRRDSGSRINHWVGGRLFPGEHHLADFDVREHDGRVDFSMRSRDGKILVFLKGQSDRELPETSRFASLEEASGFFEKGALGYSETEAGDRLDGLYLVTKRWRIDPLKVDHAHSSYFENRDLFPQGSVEFDCALLMRDIEHEWYRAPDFHLSDRSATPSS